MSARAGTEARCVSCIIPAFNEAERIGAVLDAVAGHPLVGEIIVVDDGSTDATVEIARGYAEAQVIQQPQNMGKTRALQTGLAAARHDLILLLDADLLGLTDAHVTRLIEPVQAGRADIAISLRQNAPGIWRLIGIDYISGERVFHRSLLDGHLKALGHLANFGFEVFLNSICISNSSRICIVRWAGVESPFKKAKVGMWRGLKSDALMMRDIFRTVSPLSLVGQILAMRRLRVPDHGVAKPGATEAAQGLRK